MKAIKLVALAMITLGVSSTFAYDKVEDYKSCSMGPIEVPKGNRNSSIPEIPKSSKKNLSSWRYSERQMMDFRYNDIKKKIVANNYLPLIRNAAKAFDMDPVMILGAIVGEHVFNMDMKDTAQDYLLKLPGWMRGWMAEDDFEIPLKDILREKNFDKCHVKDTEYDKWNCYGEVWNKEFRNKRCSDCRETSKYPNNGLKFTFFSPFGSTYGVGQLGPMKALMVTDLVHEKVPGMPYLSLDDIEEVYSSVLDPQKSFYYVAGTLEKIIEAYRERSCFDITTNVGVVATLYNLGGELHRASKKQRDSIKSLQRGNGVVMPEENYYGWYINEKLADLENFVENFLFPGGHSLRI